MFHIVMKFVEVTGTDYARLGGTKNDDEGLFHVVKNKIYYSSHVMITRSKEKKRYPTLEIAKERLGRTPETVELRNMVAEYNKSSRGGSVTRMDIYENQYWELILRRIDHYNKFGELPGESIITAQTYSPQCGPKLSVIMNVFTGQVNRMIPLGYDMKIIGGNKKLIGKVGMIVECKTKICKVACGTNYKEYHQVQYKNLIEMPSESGNIEDKMLGNY